MKTTNIQIKRGFYLKWWLRKRFQWQCLITIFYKDATIFWTLVQKVRILSCPVCLIFSRVENMNNFYKRIRLLTTRGLSVKDHLCIAYIFWNHSVPFWVPRQSVKCHLILCQNCPIWINLNLVLMIYARIWFEWQTCSRVCHLWRITPYLPKFEFSLLELLSVL